MEFTPEERKMIEALRRKQRAARLNWPKWAALFFGMLMIGSSIAFFVLSAHSKTVFKPASPPDMAIDLLAIKYNAEMNYVSAISFTMAIYLMVIGGNMLVVTVNRWRPNPSEALLLKLVERLEKDANSTTK